MSQTITDTTTLLASSRPYTRSSIGGAGNTHKITCSSRAPSIPRIISRLSGTFLTGIGGAGNSRSYSERASISFEDALSHNSMHKQSVAGSYHHGMGGVGNRSKPSADAGSLALSSVESNFLISAMSRQSGADRVKGRVVSFFGSSSKRSSMVDEKDDESVSGYDSCGKQN